MPYLVDTPHLIDHLNDQRSATALLEALAGDEIMMSVISYIEIMDGTLRAPNRADAEGKVRVLTAVVPILGVSEGVARRCAEIRGLLRTAGRRVNTRALDLIIAATAVEHGLTLVTRNVADYADVPGLDLHRPA